MDGTGMRVLIKTTEGEISETDNIKLARDCSSILKYTVVDTVTGKYLSKSRIRFWINWAVERIPK
jgi:hypothetical protein